MRRYKHPKLTGGKAPADVAAAAGVACVVKLETTTTTGNPAQPEPTSLKEGMIVTPGRYRLGSGRAALSFFR